MTRQLTIDPARLERFSAERERFRQAALNRHAEMREAAEELHAARHWLRQMEGVLSRGDNRELEKAKARLAKAQARSRELREAEEGSAEARDHIGQLCSRLEDYVRTGNAEW